MKIRQLLKCGLGGSMGMLLAVSPLGHAASADVQFAGFASFVYAKTLDNDEGEILTPQGNITNEGEYRDFNKLGLRMDADMQQDFSFAAQMVAYGSEDYDPDFDWIYVRYKFNPEVSLDVGKTRVPLYMYSDYIDVSYAYQWIAPPTAIYGRSYFNTLDGGKLNYVTTFGEWSSELQLFAGKTEESFSATGMDLTFNLDDSRGVAWAVEHDWLTLRLVYAELDITLDGFTVVDDLLTGLSAYSAFLPGLDLTPLEDELRLENDKNRYVGLAAAVKFDYFFATAEITHSDFEHNLATGDVDAYYLMLGTNLPANWSLSFTYGVSDGEPQEGIVDTVDQIISPYMSNPMTAPVAMMLRSTVAGSVRQAQDLETQHFLLGARWNFHPSASLKLEYLVQREDAYVFNATTFTADKVEHDPAAYRIGLDLVF